MAFADPQSVTVSGTAVSLPRTASGVNTGEFTSNDANVKLSVSHSYGKRTRRQIRLTHRKVAADPLIADQNLEYSASVYMVIDLPKVGYSVTEAKAIVDAFTAFMTASTGAKVTQLLGGEN